MSRAGVLRLMLLTAPLLMQALGAQPLWAQPVPVEPLEPPPEATGGSDYAIEPGDSLEQGDVELGIGASGRLGSAPTRRRRVRLRSDDVSLAVRDGKDDPLAGGAVEGHGALGDFSIGRLAPRWGRGLLLGAPANPWQRDALDRGAGAPFRGRAGEGVLLRRGARTGLEALYGRFARRNLVGLRLRWRGLAWGGVSDGRAGHQGSIAVEHGKGASEVVLDRSGRWRAETLLERPLVPGRDRRTGWTASLRARAGAPGFTSLAEPSRRGPGQALAFGLRGSESGTRLDLLAALWRVRPGLSGARAGLAAERPLAHHGVLALGFEEQRGSRRDAGLPGPLAAAAVRGGDLRQGWWGEWWSGEGGLALGLRHESWGGRPWAREVVRWATSAHLEAHGPAGLRLGVTHSVFRVKRGESLYLPEAESDRLVLRALSGEGGRTRIEARSPLAGGRIRAALHLDSVRGRLARPQWTLDWTRRTPVGGRRGTSAR